MHNPHHREKAPQMTWKPIDLPTGPVAKEDSDKDGRCGWCGSPDGQPCRTSGCGTYDD